MSKTLFNFNDYKKYLYYRLSGPKSRGLKSSLSEMISCQNSYLSRVINSDAHFNLEQAQKINKFFGHSETESHYFILLLQYSRAGTKELQDYFFNQIKEILDKRLILKERFQVESDLSEENRTVYYSAWYYSAIHILLSIPTLQTKEAIAKHLQLPLQKVSHVISFLILAGLAMEEGGRYKIGKTRIHLGNDSPNIIKHHTNWRIQALQSLDRETINDLHYTSIVSLAAGDFLKIKEMLIEAIEKYNATVAPSKEEKGACLALDFFNLV